MSNPNFRNGITPYIWKDGMDVGWYVYHPTPRDIEQLSEQISDYADLFMEQGYELAKTNGPSITMSM